MQKIMIVEDDATIARLVAGELEGWGYETARVTDFADVMGLFAAFAPHLLLLDLSLPHRSGFHWCAEVRKVSTVPIVFLSSAADNLNQVTALHQGADDFIAKPFDMPLLVAKVQALLRRSYDFSPPDEGAPRFGGVELDTGGMALVWAGRRLELTRNEFRMVQPLLEQPGCVVRRDELMRRLWEDESFVDDNTLSVNINRLRKKLEDAGFPLGIATKKGEGYVLTAGEGAS